MLEAITNEDVHRTVASNQPLFDRDIDYRNIVETHRASVAKWGNLSEEERKNFSNQKEFLSKNGVVDPKDQSLIPARNFHLLSSEVSARLSSQDDLQLLPIDAIDFDDSVLELAESLENIPDLRELYRLRKKTTGQDPKSGISSEEAKIVKSCLAQGRELYLAGRNGSLMVKPLNFFYSLTAYTYAAIILNNPMRFRKGNLPGSHGMAYLPEPMQAQFGGDTARGTLSDLVTSFPTHLVKTKGFELQIDCTNSIIEFYNTRFDVSIGALLSVIPEMSDYYKLTTGRRSRCYPMDLVNANTPRSLVWEFQIGDGEDRPERAGIEASFPNLSIMDRHGKYIIQVPATDTNRLKACIYTDIRGKLWYIDNPFFPIIMPEIAIHFLASSIYSNIMRYKPDEWGLIISNEVASGVSLLTRHYFSSFQKKFLVVALRAISRYLPYAL